jgi:sugar lactone lactonase YvrE
VADEVAFPNGMAGTPDNSTLILAESYGKATTEA